MAGPICVCQPVCERGEGRRDYELSPSRFARHSLSRAVKQRLRSSPSASTPRRRRRCLHRLGLTGSASPAGSSSPRSQPPRRRRTEDPCRLRRRDGRLGKPIVIRGVLRERSCRRGSRLGDGGRQRCSGQRLGFGPRVRDRSHQWPCSHHSRSSVSILDDGSPARRVGCSCRPFFVSSPRASRRRMTW